MYADLLAIAERWTLNQIVDSLQQTKADPRVTVGLLGDFSSGKSTLLNEVVGQPDLMAARLEPCTASAGWVLSVAGTEELTCFRLMPDGELEPISRSELDDVARGVIPGRPVVHVPPSEGFPDGLGLADTPGLGSMTEGHLATTLSELPYLDAAIICIDIQKGGLTKSVVEFLESPGIRHLRHRFLIALTHGDRKGPKGTADIRATTVHSLAELLGIPSNEASERVVVVAGGERARANGQADVSELHSALQRFVVDRRTSIQDERRARAAAREIPVMRALLQERAQAIRGEGGDLKKRAADVEMSIQATKKDRVAQQSRLDRFQHDLRRELAATCASHRAALASASNDDETTAATTALTAAVDATVTRCVGDFQDKFADGVGANVGGIAAHLQSVNRGADVGKTVATAALTAWLVPTPAGAGAVLSNAGQAGAGGAARVVGKAGAEGAKKVAKEAVGKRILVSVFKAIDDINPINYAGDLIAQQVKKQTLDSYLEQLTREVSQQACRKLETLFEEDIFGPQDVMLSELKEQLAAAERDRKLKQDDQQKRLRALDSDLAQLAALALQ